MYLNTERILSTDAKNIKRAFENLRQNYSDSLASDYMQNYSNKPLTFIIANSALIFSEPQFGLKFYTRIFPEFPLFSLEDELDKFGDYLDKFGTQMHPDMFKQYTSTLESMIAFKEKMSPLVQLERALIYKNGEYIKRAAERICQSICDVKIDATQPTNKLLSAIEGSNAVLNVIYMVARPDSPLLSVMSNDISKKLLDGDLSTIAGKTEVLAESVYLDRISKCELFTKAMKSIKNTTTATVFAGISTGLNINEAFLEYVNDVVSDDVVLPMVSIDSFTDSMISESVFEGITSNETYVKRESILKSKLVLYEAALSIVAADYEAMEPSNIFEESSFFTDMKNDFGIEGEMTIEDAFNMTVEAVAETEAELRLLTEYTSNGSVNKVIGNHTSIPREGDSTKSSSKKSGDEDDDDDPEIEIPERPRKRGIPSSSNLPSDAHPNTNKINKPKSTVVEKIQNGAMDLHAKSKKAAGAVRNAGTEIANAGKAVLKIPSDILNGFKSTIKTFDDMDDNRRKEFMIKPGYRKKIFKNLRIAATYGATFYVNKWMFILTWFGRKLSKEKNKRIRNEFTAELATEIKVCETKIEDALNAGDQKQRYQLIRLRDKLEREKSRVEVNGKYL